MSITFDNTDAFGVNVDSTTEKRRAFEHWYKDRGMPEPLNNGLGECAFDNTDLMWFGWRGAFDYISHDVNQLRSKFAELSQVGPYNALTYLLNRYESDDRTSGDEKKPSTCEHGDSIDTTKTIAEDFLKMVEDTANMLRGMTMDPAIPAHAKDAMRSKIAELEEGVAEFWE